TKVRLKLEWGRPRGKPPWSRLPRPGKSSETRPADTSSAFLREAGRGGSVGNPPCGLAHLRQPAIDYLADPLVRNSFGLGQFAHRLRRGNSESEVSFDQAPLAGVKDGEQLRQQGKVVGVRRCRLLRAGGLHLLDVEQPAAGAGAAALTQP